MPYSYRIKFEVKSDIVVTKPASILTVTETGKNQFLLKVNYATSESKTEKNIVKIDFPTAVGSTKGI